MPGLRDLAWAATYSTDTEDLVAAFYQPCLERSIAYWRAVGYFSSRVLALISPAIEQFYAQNGKMRLVASPALSENDRATIRAAYEQRAEAEQLREDETVIACLRRYLDPGRLVSDEERLRLRLLAGMIRDGLLDIRIAVRVHPDGDVGLYHENFQRITQRVMEWLGTQRRELRSAPVLGPRSGTRSQRAVPLPADVGRTAPRGRAVRAQ